jgi:hypothetical protein
MPPRGRARDVIVLALALFGFAAPVRAGACQSDPRPDEVQVLLVELVVFRGVGGGQIEQLRTEIEQVWAAQGVTIAWTSVPSPASVRVVVDRPTTALPVATGDGTWSVAHARVVRGHVVPPIYASVEAAERVVRAAAQASGRGEHGLLLTRVLARAIAHELAHLLLDTRTHTERGLLRERFTDAEFVAPVADGFGLDTGQQLALRRHRLLLTARAEAASASDVPAAVAAGLPQVRGVAMVGQREPRPCSFVAVSRLAARADPRVESAMLVEP